MKKFALPNIPYVVVFIAAWKISGQLPWIPYNDVLVGLAAAVAIRITVYIKGKNAKSLYNIIFSILHRASKSSDKYSNECKNRYLQGIIQRMFTIFP